MSFQPANHTESSILQSFLLPPTPLPTVLPYTTFLKVVPAKYAGDPSYSRVLKRLYRDLQLQRDLDVETVRANIERECTRAPTLLATLARQIVNEEDDFSHKENAPPKKRKRPTYGSDDEHESVDADMSDSAMAMNANEDDDVKDMDTDDELQHESTVQFAFAQHPLNAHPAADFTPAPTSARSASRKLYTKSELLQAMQHASDGLVRENEGLEELCRKQLAVLKETVGGLSDLRYGTFNGKSGSAEDKVGELVGAINGLREILNSKVIGKRNVE